MARRLRLLALAVFALAAATGASAHGPGGVPEPTPEAAASALTSTLEGRVDELVVEDLVRRTTHTFAVLVQEDGQRLLLRGESARNLGTGTAVTVRGNVVGHTLFAKAVAPRTRSNVGEAVRTPTREYRGLLRLAHADNFDGQPSEFIFLLYAADGTHAKVKLAAQLGVLANKMEVAVSGRLDVDGELIAERIVIEGIAVDERKADFSPAAVTSNVLVIPIKFKDGAGVYPADPFTVAAIDTVVFGTGSSVARYYQEASYGQQLLAGLVANDAGSWLKSSVAAPTPIGCNTSLIQTQGDAAASAAGHNLASYPYRVYVFASAGFNCPWSGLGGVGYGRAWIKQTTNLLVYGHELGHNFGLYHAASLDCGVNVIGGTCTGSEYGDPFNMMGNQRAMHFGAVQKRELNYLPASAVATHTSGSTTYSLTPLESAGGSLYAVQIPAAANRVYWLEFRQPLGFDSALAAYPNNGAQFRVAYPFEGTCSGCSDDSAFLDMTPATAPFTDGTLLAGQSFVDSTYGITVDVLTATPSALTVQVTKGSPVPTTTALASSVNPSMENQSVTLTATVNGSNPGGNVVFKNGAATISGCSAVALGGSGNARTAACTTSALVQGAHSLTAEYGGNAGNAASTSAALSQVIRPQRLFHQRPD